jgi:hypothetical protein
MAGTYLVVEPSLVEQVKEVSRVLICVPRKSMVSCVMVLGRAGSERYSHLRPEGQDVCGINNNPTIFQILLLASRPYIHIIIRSPNYE